MGGGRTNRGSPSSGDPTEPRPDPETRSGVRQGLDWEDETVIELEADDSLAVAGGDMIHALSAAYPAIANYGRFEVLGRLAVGGMAEVFLARETRPHETFRHVAIKRILPQIADDETFVEMFLDEARLAVRLNHPNICHIYDFGELEDSYFISMEFVHGVPLGKMIKRTREKGALPIPVATRVIAHVAEALHYAHQARDGMGRPMNIVHRDVSPQNIMVRFDGVVKLLDFGIAKNATQSSVTEAGVVKGKFSYMSPEQCLGRNIDARTDIFALGACLYEALTGQSVFRRTSDLDTMRAIVHEDPAPLTTVRSDVPPILNDIVFKALEKDPRKRYQTAGDMYVALERFVAERGDFVRAMHLSQYLERLLPGEAAAGPLPGSTPSGRALALADVASGSNTSGPTANMNTPPKAPPDEATLDVHISVVNQEQKQQAARERKPSIPSLTDNLAPPENIPPPPPPPAPQLDLLDEDDDAPTTQVPAEEIHAALSDAGVNLDWLDDELPTTRVPSPDDEPPTLPALGQGELAMLAGIDLETADAETAPVRPRGDPTRDDRPKVVGGAALAADAEPAPVLGQPVTDPPRPIADDGGRPWWVWAVAILVSTIVVGGAGVYLGLYGFGLPTAAKVDLPPRDPAPVVPLVPEPAQLVDTQADDNEAVPADGTNDVTDTEETPDGPEEAADTPEASDSEEPADSEPEAEEPESEAAEAEPAEVVANMATPVVSGATGRLEIESSPSGARVTVRDWEGATPFTIEEIPVGPHVVVVQRPGFQRWRRTVRIREGGTTAIRASLERANAPASGALGFLSLDTRPSATVYVGNRLLGRTPIRNQPVPAGTLRLRLVDETGRSHVRSVQVREGEVSRAFLPLQ